jgi:hypothetical protein
MTESCVCSPDDDDWCPACDAPGTVTQRSSPRLVEPLGTINDPGDAGDFEEWWNGPSE